MRAGQRLELLERHSLYPLAAGIVDELARKGHFSVLAGGCVRDGLLGVSPKDLDIATSAPPDLVEQSFPRTLPVGKAFGTIVVVEQGHNFEVTTFRAEGGYVDGRHPSEVRFTDAEEDAKRRDFTVNALFYDLRAGEVLDFVGGIEDLRARKLVTVGEADERFQEDRLRMLRAVRFVGQLGFDLDGAALKAIQQQYQALEVVSIERVFNETRRLLESEHLVKGMDALLRSNLHKVYWPELAAVNLSQLARFPRFQSWENAFAAMAWLAGVADVEPRLRQWKVSRESLRRIQTELQAVKVLSDPKSSRAQRLRALGGDVFADVMVLAEGVFEAEQVAQWVKEFLAIATDKGELPKPFVTGADLLSVGVVPGEEMGRLLKSSYDAQLEGRVGDRESALRMIRKA